MEPILLRERDAATIVIRLGGELDAATCDDLAPTLLAAAEMWERIFVDVSAVMLCTSAAIAMFLQCSDVAAERGGRVALVNPSAAVQRLIRLFGLTQLVAS